MELITIDPGWVAGQVLDQLAKSTQDPHCPVRVYWPGEADPTDENVWARLLDVAVEPASRSQREGEPDSSASVMVTVAVACSDVALDPGEGAGSVLAPWRAARVIGWLLDGHHAASNGHRLTLKRATYPPVGQVDEADPTKWALAVVARGTADRFEGTAPVSVD